MSDGIAGQPLLRLLQLTSPSLPVGAFAYSQGLESAIEMGWVKDEPSLSQWLQDQLDYSIGRVDLPVFVRLYSALAAKDETAALAWSRRLVAMRETSELVADDCARGKALGRLLTNLGIPNVDIWRKQTDTPFVALAAVAAVGWEIAAVTNDIYTKEDAEFLVRKMALAPGRIVGVETGGCPHTAIREDASMNLAAIDDLCELYPTLDMILIESGGDNLAATFSPDLADLTIYVIDVAEGEKIPRKGGPGITRSDLLVINKTDLAPYVGASLEVMDSDTKRMRGDRPYVFTNLVKDEGIEFVKDFILREGVLTDLPGKN